MKKINIKIDKKNYLYFLIYGGILFILFLVGILPLYLKNVYHTKENDKLKYQIKEQKELAPTYANLLSVMKGKNSLVLPNPEKTALLRSESGKFQTDFKILAKKSGLSIISFIPDINSSASPSTSFLHNVVLKGEFSDLRKMLIELGTVPYLDRIEEINIKQRTDFMEFTMKIWIAIK
jgi:hypothetical protein